MTRGLLTDMERKALKGEIDDPNQRSTYVARVRQRLEERTAEDIRILHENEPELFETLREQVDTVPE
jgi:hypothetical protein